MAKKIKPKQAPPQSPPEIPLEEGKEYALRIGWQIKYPQAFARLNADWSASRAYTMSLLSPEEIAARGVDVDWLLFGQRMRVNQYADRQVMDKHRGFVALTHLEDIGAEALAVDFGEVEYGIFTPREMPQWLAELLAAH